MNGLICENCGVVLALDARNGKEDTKGESSAWVEVNAGGLSVDACSRSCATVLLADGGPLAAVIDAHLTVISEIARIVYDDDPDERSGLG